jgi:uncharacterized protein (DUF1786 family)
MTRMQAVASTWSGTAPLFLMDTGPAAILGAMDDRALASLDSQLVVNLGNFHTIAAVLEDREIRALFEHHTGELTAARLEDYLQRLGAGTVSNDEVFQDMGHGAFQSASLERGAPQLAVIGPRRGLLQGSRLEPHFAVPHGDMMLAGCFGLLRALAVRLPQFGASIEEQLGRPTDPSADSRDG